MIPPQQELVPRNQSMNQIIEQNQTQQTNQTQGLDILAQAAAHRQQQRTENKNQSLETNKDTTKGS